MRILFIGSVPDHIPGTDQTIAPEHQPLFEAASELGYAAVLRGHTILLGSESPRTIDFYVMRGILNACATKPDQEFFVEIHRPEGTAAPYPSVPKNLKVSRISYEQDSKAEFRWMVAHVLALDSSDVCIAIGGGASTRVIGYIAAERQKAILAIASFGGSAKILWEKLKFVYKNHFKEGAAGRWLTTTWSEHHATEIIGLAETFGRQRTREAPHTYFVSYSWKDAALADHIEVVLHRFNRIVLRDENSIGGGEMLSNAVATMINEADTFLAVYSEHFSNSSWCPQELEYARNRNLKGLKPKRIILVAIDSSLAPLSLY
jgi:TIR domain